MAESRGGKEDRRLKKSFNRICIEETEYISSEKINEFITSKSLKVKVKNNNISGLQIADLIAHPSWRLMLNQKCYTEMPYSFGRKIAEILINKKYYRDDSGKIEGLGQKWLP